VKWETMADPRHRRRVIAWLVISQAVGLLSLAPWLLMAGLSTMAFDSGYSTGAALFVGAVLSYPVLPVGAAIIAWVLFARRRDSAALVATSVPLVLALPLIGWLGYVWLLNTVLGP
jgi:hypothetical protein